MALNARQQNFVNEYLIDLNGGAAATRAGYSQKTCRQIASHLLTRPDVAEAVDLALAKRNALLEVTADTILAELDKLAMMEVLSLVDDGGIARFAGRRTTRDQAAALSVKLAALVSAGKHRGMFREKVDVEHTGGITVVLASDEAGL